MTDKPPLNPDHLSYLAPIGIEVLDQNGTHSFTPNDILVAFARDNIQDTLRPIDGLQSICSGEPAVIYRTAEAEFALTPEELRRLTFKSLTPAEFMAIRDKVGDLFDIHDDFYDQRTGEALQPLILSTEQQRTP